MALVGDYMWPAHWTGHDQPHDRGACHRCEMEAATAGGTGNPRTLLDPAEVTVVQTMTALVVAGLKPAAAAPLARQLAELGVASLGRFTILDRTGT